LRQSRERWFSSCAHTSAQTCTWDSGTGLPARIFSTSGLFSCRTAPTGVLAALIREHFFGPAVRAKVRELDPNLPIYGMRTTEVQITNSLTTERMIASLSTVFGFLAMLLATIGLYGVMAYTVAQRRREIGIRMALGAAQGNVMWMVMREVLLLVAIGVGAGVPVSLALMRAVASQLYGVTAHDPSTLVLATGGLALVACAAGYIPALRASRLDPMVALRYE